MRGIALRLKFIYQNSGRDSKIDASSVEAGVYVRRFGIILGLLGLPCLAQQYQGVPPVQINTPEVSAVMAQAKAIGQANIDAQRQMVRQEMASPSSPQAAHNVEILKQLKGVMEGGRVVRTQ
jgi:hypothetical protein